jgi:hypothetical protein
MLLQLLVLTFQSAGILEVILKILTLLIKLSEHRSHGHVPMISHPYDDSSAVYLGTVILTILCFQHLFATTSEQEYTLNRPPPCETNSYINQLEVNPDQLKVLPTKLITGCNLPLRLVKRPFLGTS